MIWFVLILTMIWAVAPQLWNEWGFRLCVLVSLGANVVLGLLSRTRRRSASGRWAPKGQRVLISIIWASYQLAEAATTSAISSLTLCDSDVSDDEKQLVALWAPFLLLHLGGPDNLTAHDLEDNKLSKRKWFEMMGHLVGVVYAIYKYTYRGGGHSWVLLAASVIVFVAGATRYIERAYALSKANLDKMQEDTSSSSGSSKKKTQECHRCRSTEDKMDQLKYRIEGKQLWKLSDREALLLAQDLFPIWRHAMVDSSVIPKSRRQLVSEEILRLELGSMCKVAEMELSLMYEVLYTKAIVAHSCPGWYYLIRFLSPLCTAAAALLFWLHRQQQQQGRIRGSFVGITYALLLIDFLLDLAWLLRALGSTWAYAYMQQMQALAWLRHQVLCPGGWRRLHRFVLRVDPMSWLLCRDPVSNRTWSGTIGRYNLLRECTTTRHSLWPGWLEPKETLYLYKLRGQVKELLFRRVQKILLEAIENVNKCKEYYSMDDIRSKWGQKAFDLRNREGSRRIDLFPGLGIEDEVAPKFGKEFEEDVLAWHIATCIVLQYIRQRQRRRSDVRGPPPLVLPQRSEDHASAIAVMSEYMMFLVAVRRDMLPGLVLHSLCKVIQETLVDIWDQDKQTPFLTPDENRKAANNEEKLALILRRVSSGEDKEEESIKFEGSEGTELLWDAVTLFRSLMLAGDTPEDRVIRENAITTSSERVRRQTRVPVPELLEFIFNVWVDKLLYAAVRCSRESHAKQLSAGGNLTTVLWMVIQHAGPFRTGELRPMYFDIPRPTAPPSPPVSQARPPTGPSVPETAAAPQPRPASLSPPKTWPWVPETAAAPPPPPVPQAQPPTWPSAPVPTSPDEDEDEYSDDDDTEEYNKRVKYITLY